MRFHRCCAGFLEVSPGSYPPLRSTLPRGFAALRTISAFLVVGTMCFASRAHAEPLQESVLRLKPGATVRIEFEPSSRLEGQFLRANADTLFLSGESSELAAPLQDVNKLWQRGRSTKTGALIGGVLGGVGLAVIASLLSAISDEPSSDGTTAGAAVAGVAGGALVGGLIGAAIPKWHRHYP